MQTSTDICLLIRFEIPSVDIKLFINRFLKTSNKILAIFHQTLKPILDDLILLIENANILLKVYDVNNCDETSCVISIDCGRKGLLNRVEVSPKDDVAAFSSPNCVHIVDLRVSTNAWGIFDFFHFSRSQFH